MGRDLRSLISDDFVIKLYSTFCKEQPMVEIKGCAFLNTGRLCDIIKFFEQQLGQDFVVKIELEAELY